MKRIAGITNLKFIYGSPFLILQRNIASPYRRSTMAATRRFFANALAAVRSFSIELYAAHGGWAPAIRG